MTEHAIVRARRCALGAAVLAAPFLCAAALAQAPAAIEIDAATIEGRLSPLLYGQFLEFMFEGIKRGLHAELLRNRSFEEEPDATGLSRYWERYPDRRNDDYAISFSRDAAGAFPPAGDADGALPPHALRLRGAGAGENRHRVPRIRLDPDGIIYRTCDGCHRS